jgi:putative transposase
MFAAEIRKRRLHHRSFSHWRWHLDEVFVRINGETHYLWRAVDHEGEVLEVFATKRRDRRAALKFLKRMMKRYGRPRSIVTDRLRSYRSAMLPIRSAVGGSTIGLRIPTSRSGDEKERWRSSEM